MSDYEGSAKGEAARGAALEVARALVELGGQPEEAAAHLHEALGREVV